MITSFRPEQLLQDGAFAWRKLRKDWSFTVIVTLTLALGIAANTTIFSLMNPYFFRPLPFGDSDRLVQIEQFDPINEWRARLSLSQYADWRERSRAFEDMAAYYYGTANVTGSEGPERIGVGYLTANTFSLLRSPAALTLAAVLVLFAGVGHGGEHRPRGPGGAGEPTGRFALGVAQGHPAFDR